MNRRLRVSARGLTIVAAALAGGGVLGACGGNHDASNPAPDGEIIVAAASEITSP